MPVITLTDISIRNLKPVPGKRVTYLDKSTRGFGIRITENGQMSYVLTYGPNRTRVKLGDVGVIKLAEARHKARTLLAERQFEPSPNWWTPLISSEGSRKVSNGPGTASLYG